MADMAGSRRVDVPCFPAPRRGEQRSPYRERLAPNHEPPASGVVSTGKVRLVVVRPDPPEQSRHAFLRQPMTVEPPPPVGWFRWALSLPVPFFRQHPLVLFWLLTVPVVTVPIATLWWWWAEQHHVLAVFAG